jgi:hypothetical protein
MHEVFAHLDHVPFWRAAIRGERSDFAAVLGGYVAAVDWPVSAFWRALSATYPSAIVVLSVRDSARTWWESANATILPVGRAKPQPGHTDVEWHGMFTELLRERFTPDWNDRDAAMAAYERHNAAVRRGVAPKRLVEWLPSDGWQPLCDALNLPVPDEPFPQQNSREEWIARRAGRSQTD